MGKNRRGVGWDKKSSHCFGICKNAGGVKFMYLTIETHCYIHLCVQYYTVNLFQRYVSEPL